VDGSVVDALEAEVVLKARYWPLVMAMTVLNRTRETPRAVIMIDRRGAASIGR